MVDLSNVSKTARVRQALRYPLAPIRCRIRRPQVTITGSPAVHALSANRCRSMLDRFDTKRLVSEPLSIRDRTAITRIAARWTGLLLHHAMQGPSKPKRLRSPGLPACRTMKLGQGPTSQRAMTIFPELRQELQTARFPRRMQSTAFHPEAPK